MFIRNKSSVTLTEDGQIFLPHAKKIMETFELAKLEVSRLPREITICSVMSVSSEFLPRIISQFKQDKPYVHVTVKTGFSTDLISMVEEEKLAFAFVDVYKRQSRRCIFTFFTRSSVDWWMWVKRLIRFPV